MWSRFLGSKDMQGYTNKELLQYRKALLEYEKAIKKYIGEYVREKKELDAKLRERLTKLEYAALEAEEDRINSDVTYWSNLTWVH